MERISFGVLISLIVVACAAQTERVESVDKPLGKADVASYCGLFGFEEDCDLCAEFDWYSDGECDDFCDAPDPDCASTCPTLSPPAPNFCENDARPLPIHENECVVGYECPTDTCPDIVRPAPGFCGDDSSPVPEYNGPCIVGYTCPAPNDSADE